MKCFARQSKGFSIIELVVVIGIIAVLLAMLMPALLSARNRSRKTLEISNIRQIAVAWNLYSNANKDGALPGYLEAAVQESWRVSYKFPNSSKVPPAPRFRPSDPNTAGPWTWRLMPYFDYSHDVVRYYTDEDTPDILAMSDPNRADDIAEHPAFAYNGHYIGGYYEMQAVPRPGEDPVLVALTRFKSARDSRGRLANLVSRTISAVNRPDQIVTFSTSAELPAGVVRDVLDDTPGSDLAHPPFLASQRQWGEDRAGLNRFEVYTDGAPTPIGRYDGAVVVLFADGHAGQETQLALDDMRKWVDEADTADWHHE